MTPKSPLTSHALRRISADSILAALRQGEVMTVTELMTATRLSRTAVHDACGDLLLRGWIQEPEAPSLVDVGRGRPPRRYVYAARAGVTVSVDLGVHTITVRVTDLRGTALASAERHLEDPAGADRLTILDEMTDDALATAHTDSKRVLAATVGVPMSLSPARAIPYLPEQSVIDLTQTWARGREWTLLLENDANLAALAERWCGCGQDEENFVVILAGERLGAGIVVDGRLLRGEHSSAGELRFLSLIPSVEREWLGIARHTRLLAAQALSSGTATAGLRAARDASETGEVSSSAVFEAAEAGDESALLVVRTVCGRLGQIIGVLATLLDPAVVIIAGGVAEAGAFVATVTESLLPRGVMDNIPRIAASPLGHDVVVTGGVRLALDHIEHHLLDDLDRPPESTRPKLPR
ncbi:MAG: ROK family protein [Ornithinimicrobium sp.]